MPIYDFECECGQKKHDEFTHSWKDKVFCNKCKKEMKKLFVNTFYAKVFPRGGLYLEHVSATGHTFHSEKEMRQWEKATGQQLGALL